MNNADIERANEAPYSLISALSIVTEFLAPATFGILFGYFISTLSNHQTYGLIGFVAGLSAALMMAGVAHRVTCTFTGSTHLGCPTHTLALRLLAAEDALTDAAKRVKGSRS